MNYEYILAVMHTFTFKFQVRIHLVVIATRRSFRTLMLILYQRISRHGIGKRLDIEPV